MNDDARNHEREKKNTGKACSILEYGEVQVDVSFYEANIYLLKYSINILNFIQPEVSLPRLGQPTTGPHPKFS
jgi:hypothetical protein